jgi:peptidoglycan/LPS O-acetylase OafA/YrhL
VFAHWNWRTHPSATRLWQVSSALYIGLILAAWLLLKYYDEPLRGFLTRKLAQASKADAPAALPISSS